MGGFVKMDGRKDYRVEMDSVGAKDVPENVYYCLLYTSRCV